MKTFNRSPAGFTLIELLTVIAILGILAAIIIPTVGKARETAQRAVDANNLRELSKAAMIYAADNRDVLPNPQQTSRTIAGTNERYWQWFGQLARYGGFNDPTLLISKLDAAVDQTALPPTVLDPTISTPPTLESAFTGLGTTSFNVVAGLRVNDASTTPLAFTRGLRSDGTWSGDGASEDDVNRGVYAETGGHIVFLGGNVEFFSAVEGTLISNTGRTTSNLRQAVPNRTNGTTAVQILGQDSGNGIVSANGTGALQGP
ncbi:type II secretion system protein [Synoicihabitans lomoniglobus]|uniref:Prepilin-type N-terminal cleavage/methylation domain-containing protein n=1 Tax=Synoicihabitans lomoniglobus TaxID=2909285 RepID=A0AAF0CSB9_9BACT|nr:prepilin-type N-terminal cleavage/methylation domain-containing protein [Opitutaceae bacterium LMO-M01]WED67101.1 prepilin-type N-terminal cleavage/methylation domain-containing protein [Opitutaceae bacterium LMO-M01]